MTPDQELKLLREALAVAEETIKDQWQFLTWLGYDALYIGDDYKKASRSKRVDIEKAVSRITALKAQASEKPTRKAREFWIHGMDIPTSTGWNVTGALIIGANTPEEGHVLFREVLSDESEARDE